MSTSDTPTTPASDKPKQVNDRDTCLGCGCLTVLIIGIVWGISALVGGGHTDGATTATPAASRPTSAGTQQPSSDAPQPTSKPLRTATTPAKADPARKPAQELADLDGDDRPASDYQQILEQFAQKCTQSPARLAELAYGTLAVLQKDGISDENEYSVLEHLNESVPVGSPKMDCQSIAAAYVTIRES